MINMKKGILLSTASICIIMLAVMFYGKQDAVKYYEPREIALNQDGANGAAEWLHNIRANQITGKVNPQDVEKAMDQVRSVKGKKSAVNLQWQEMGPSTIGGRTRAILIDPNDSKIMFAGAVSGGLFKTTNGGATWNKVSADLNPMISSITMAPNGDIYYGTGEGMYAGAGGDGGSGFRGEGVFKSTDGGNTFFQLPSTASWLAAGKVGTDPSNSNRIYAATNLGLRVSDDAGDTWQNAITGFSAASDMFVTVSGQVWVKQGATIYKSNNGDPGSYNAITSIPDFNGQGRARIAVSPEDENYVYVAACTQPGEFDKAYQSKDGGATWTIIGRRSSLLNPHAAQGNPQGRYNNMLGVSPIDKERIFMGGVTLWEWSASNGWLQIASLASLPTNIFYVHADNHEIKFDPNDPTKIFVGNDGGIFKSTDNGVTWSAEVRNYVTTQFYHIAVGSNGEMLGGTQDNGTILVDPSAQFPKTGIRTPGILLNGVTRDGDGGDAEISRLDPDILFKEMQYGLMGRSVDGGQSFVYVLDNDVDAKNRVGDPSFSAFVTPFTLWEKRFDDLSEDSVVFRADSVFLSIGFGNGSTTYNGTINPAQDAAKLIPSGLTIRAGSLRLRSDANGNITGVNNNGTGTYTITTNPDGTQIGRYVVTFDRPISLEIIARAAVRYESGDVLNVESATNDLPIVYTLQSDLNPTEQVSIQDPAQSMLFIGVKSESAGAGALDRNEIGGVWMTREALTDLNGTPTWYHIAKLGGAFTPQSMEVSADGNTLWLGTSNGRLYRITNLNNARDSASTSVNDFYLAGSIARPNTSVIQTTLVANYFGRAITDIAVHPVYPDRVAVTVGSYGNTEFVYVSENALQASPDFNAVQGDLPQMPAYAVTFNFKDTVTNPRQLIVGTEFGVYGTDDYLASNVVWTSENNGIDPVPVFDLIQDRAVRVDIKAPSDFEGDIYAGTHGRGIFRTSSVSGTISIDEPQKVEKQALVNKLEIFPNPAKDQVSIALNLENRADVAINIRDINGKLVKTQNFKKLARGTKDVTLDISRLAAGSYILSLQEGTKVRTGKLIVSK